mmetsp:Transcript_68772/g.164093  ORF Transcript_68772/g.164093 Transcript_68772/m.164093 type:complete len:250 (+) Transcript_68772:231-980(+)
MFGGADRRAPPRHLLRPVLDAGDSCRHAHLPCPRDVPQVQTRDGRGLPSGRAPRIQPKRRVPRSHKLQGYGGAPAGFLAGVRRLRAGDACQTPPPRHARGARVRGVLRRHAVWLRRRPPYRTPGGAHGRGEVAPRRGRRGWGEEGEGRGCGGVGRWHAPPGKRGVQALPAVAAVAALPVLRARVPLSVLPRRGHPGRARDHVGDADDLRVVLARAACSQQGLRVRRRPYRHRGRRHVAGWGGRARPDHA